MSSDDTTTTMPMQQRGFGIVKDNKHMFAGGGAAGINIVFTYPICNQILNIE